MNVLTDNFVEKILPANYWITKSMEFTKVKTSGTLWYLKKWIVYYQYIFFKPSLHQNEYNEISAIFNDYIESLPENAEVKQNAKDFFFDINIEDNNSFMKMNDFLNNSQSFHDEKEKQSYLLTAKKFYFTYIMGLGGQSGYKKFIKDKINDGNSYEKTLELLSVKLEEDDESEKYTGLINDFHAALRNERQIFFYYGFFHGKENADLSGFYNLTNIGKTIIGSTFDELLLTWEHQKIKMVSQSPMTDMQNIDDCGEFNTDNFSIDYHPYITLLEIITNNNAITTDEYHYVISKLDKDSDIEAISENIAELEAVSVEKAKSFNRRAELKNEDFDKELKKFILGISKLPKDETSNYFSFLTSIKSKKISVLNTSKANFILKNYKFIKKFLDEKYINIYQDFEEELKKKYISIVNESAYELSVSTKYEWSKYIINFDKTLYLFLIYISIALKNNCYSYTVNQN